jgi:hypothetical protein
MALRLMGRCEMSHPNATLDMHGCGFVCVSHCNTLGFSAEISDIMHGRLHSMEFDVKVRDSIFVRQNNSLTCRSWRSSLLAIANVTI